MPKALPYFLIVLILLIAGGFYLDHVRSKALNNVIGTSAPTANQTGTKPDFQNFGPASDFSGASQWLNSQPLTIQSLKGKVVLVDFWTYSCINCIRTLPFVTSWYDKYKADDLVVVGVHTPEFAFEKVTANVQNAIQQFNIHYPVAQDNDYKIWNSYNNQYWPAEYLINKDGQIVYEHFGEGNYDKTENAIRELLGLADDMNAKTSGLGNIQSPEMYFGIDRLEYLDSSQTPWPTAKQFTFPKNLALNNFALAGSWKFDHDRATLAQDGGKIRLHFSSGKVYMVASADQPVTLHISVDGKPQPDVVVQASQLYTLFDSSDYSEHTIDITIDKADFNAFTFTFG